MQRVSLWVALAAIVVVLAAACSGGGDEDRSEANLRRTAEQFVVDLVDEDVSPQEMSRYFPVACGEEVTEAVLLARAVIGDADVTLDILNVEFEAAERARVTAVLVIDGEAFGGEEAEAGLWVFEDGRWRNADDCEQFGT